MIIARWGAVRLRRARGFVLATASLVSWSCQPAPTVARPDARTIRIGVGLGLSAAEQNGFRQVIPIFEREGLLGIGRDGRPQPWLADKWTVSPDGLNLSIRLKSGLTFHNGAPVLAAPLVPYFRRGLSVTLGPWVKDVAEVVAADGQTLEFRLSRPSTFVLEALDLPVVDPVSGSPTGPYRIRTPLVAGAPLPESVELERNPDYHAGQPFIERIVLKPYPSPRGAWADLLRDELDVLYEVAANTSDSLLGSSRVNVFRVRRNYMYAIIMNVRRPALRDKRVRQLLNHAVDRAALVENGLGGQATPADTPVSRDHWAFDPTAPRFAFSPEPLPAPLAITCILPSVTPERLVLLLQRQLQDVGVEMKPEVLTLDETNARWERGDFDCYIADMVSGPSFVRPALFWGTDGPFNHSGFTSAAVDESLERIRGATTDDEYRAGVAAYQRAIADDPPAVFLTWSERLRAVSSAFEIASEPGRDPLNLIRLWRPAPAGTQSRPTN